jgi:hypothetical protein
MGKSPKFPYVIFSARFAVPSRQKLLKTSAGPELSDNLNLQAR